MLCPIFTEVNSRIIGLISIEYGVDFASEAWHELVMHELQHGVEINLYFILLT
jgi:hypothetical protein